MAARAVQGLGAAMMTPQTMATITRIFPSERRGAAMALDAVNGLLDGICRVHGIRQAA